MMNGNFLVIVHLSLPKSEKILFLLILLNYLASNFINYTFIFSYCIFVSNMSDKKLP